VGKNVKKEKRERPSAIKNFGSTIIRLKRVRVTCATEFVHDHLRE